ncbi:unnamed protein product [Adineta steineri]|uniref:ETS domain-containing protein n=1 Tax=Adineta steineri TaxID=433720 RepID=A0A813QIT4_9BILA|nr:unnamed protein product [Adineta steineri]CAF3817560.1 unnamed protein product [Adineta steineri]
MENFTMYDECNENFDPLFSDDMFNISSDDFSMDDDSDIILTSIKDWFKLSPTTNPDDIIDTYSDEIPLNRKEWLIQDSPSQRYRAPRLFEFLILLLRKSHYESYASFTDRSKGIFQVHRPDKIAELWQAVKSRQSQQKMTYDKFARAIRWYYKSNLMQKTNTRYTFQFSSKTLEKYFIDENNNSSTNLRL